MSEFKNKENPIPNGNYITASRFGNIVYSAGMTPKNNGFLMQSEKISINQPISFYKTAMRQAVENALTAVENTLTDEERLEKILTVTVYINAEEEFQAHSRLADFASDHLYEKMGKKGIGSRAAVGVSSLPGGAPFEIQLIAGIMNDPER